MKNAPKPNLRKPPKRGTEIAVLESTGAHRGRVVSTRGGRSFTWKQDGDWYVTTLKRRDEGVTWARGWNSEAGLALRARAALLRDATSDFAVAVVNYDSAIVTG